jgi:hypothetical protein
MSERYDFSNPEYPRLAWDRVERTWVPREKARPNNEASVDTRSAEPFIGSNELITEDSCALQFAALYGDRLRYDHDAGKWFEWTGAIWKPNRTCLAFHYARKLARKMAVSAESDKKRYVTEKAAFAAAVERLAKSDKDLLANSRYRQISSQNPQGNFRKRSDSASSTVQNNFLHGVQPPLLIVRVATPLLASARARFFRPE